MTSQQSSATPDRELVLRLQQDPSNHQAFEALYDRLSEEFNRSSYLAGFSKDDQEDIISDFWRKVWQKLPEFQYQSGPAFRGWLTTILKNTCIDHHRRQKRLQERLPMSIYQEVQGEDSGIVELIDLIPSNLGEDLTDRAQRELILEVAQECLNNKDQLELLRCRLMKEPLPAGRDANWINSNWHRLQKSIIEAFKNRRYLENAENEDP